MKVKLIKMRDRKGRRKGAGVKDREAASQSSRRLWWMKRREEKSIGRYTRTMNVAEERPERQIEKAGSD